MIILWIGLMYAASVHIFGYSIYGAKFAIYLTSWCAVIQTATLIHLLFVKMPTTLTKTLLITSWSIGWGVVIIFWLVIFPSFDSKSLPPVPLYLSTHGGLHFFIVYYYLKSKIRVKLEDLKASLYICLFYFFGMILPLKFSGVTVYPHFMEKLWPTIISLFGTLGIIILSFFSGFYLKKNRVLKKN